MQTNLRGRDLIDLQEWTKASNIPGGDYPPLEPWTPDRAEAEFLSRFVQLTY